MQKGVSMFKKILKTGLLLLLVVFLIFVLLYSVQKMKQIKYASLKIEIPENTPRYLDESGVRKVVMSYVPSLMSMSIDSVDLGALEQRLESVAAIKNAEVYHKILIDDFQLSAQLVVHVYQREPIVRVLSGGRDYYMDAEGVSIGERGAYARKVILITGKVDEEYLRKELLPLIEFIRCDEFWRAQIKDIYVDANGELTMLPLVGDETVLFGSPERYEEKFRNLKALYEQGFSKFGWNKYKTIDLRYRGQVVCGKK